MITANTHGAPNWVDLATPDVEGATTFYSKLLDWEVEMSETPMGEYFIGKTSGRQVAGMMKAPPDTGDMAMWTVFINVEDLEETSQKVEAFGGTVVEPPFDIPEARIAVVADPTGAMFGLFSGPDIDGVWLTHDLGGVSWVETLTRDSAASEAFYTAVFDWKAETQDKGGSLYTVFTLDGDMVAGMMTMPESVPPEAPAHWSVYFTVADCENAVARAVDLGGNALMPTMNMDTGRFAVLSDPQGGVFQVMEYNE
jgi:predicted enzyme related to lactoylglutathione lyase